MRIEVWYLENPIFICFEGLGKLCREYSFHYCLVWTSLMMTYIRQAKDVIRGIKKRLGSKNPRVQLLVLTVSYEHPYQYHRLHFN